VLKNIKEHSKLVLLLSFILLVGFSIIGCDSADIGDTDPDTYNAEVIIEGVANLDHAEFFSVLSDGESGVDQFSYENNILSGNITGLSGTKELTLVIDDDNLEDGEYTFDNEVVAVDSDNNEAKFTVEFIEKTPKIAEIDINEDVQDISVYYGTSKEDAISQLVDEITIKDTDVNEYAVSLDWSIEDYDSELADEYTATGTFELPEGVEQTDPATDLEVEAIVTVQEKTHSLNIETEGEGTVNVDPDSNEYTAGTEVTLLAIPDSGWEFSHWQGDVDDSNSAETTITMNEDKTVTAHFREIETTTLFNEDFNDELPENWDIIVGGSTDDTWSRKSLGGTYIMIADSDALGLGVLMDEELRTPEINIPDSQGRVILSFEHYYGHTSSSLGTVKVYDGTEWVEVKIFKETSGSWPDLTEEVIDITEHANEKLRVSFHYTDGGSWAWYWAIDNVKIEVVE